MSIEKTDILIQEFKDSIEKHFSAGSIISYNRLFGEVGHYVKVKSIKQCGGISSASVQLGMNRTTLAEYLRKISLSLTDILNGNH